MQIKQSRYASVRGLNDLSADVIRYRRTQNSHPVNETVWAKT